MKIFIGFKKVFLSILIYISLNGSFIDFRFNSDSNIFVNFSSIQQSKET